jgi:hypothetical protein
MIRYVFLFTLLVVGCQRSPYSGYKALDGDVHLHYVMLGDGTILPSDSDSVRIRLRMGWQGRGIGELFSTEDMYAVKDLRTGPFIPIFDRIHAGDSMSVIAPAGAWPWSAIVGGKDVAIPDSGKVQVEVGLIAIRTPAMIRAAVERYRRNDPLGFERRLIASYRASASEPFTQWGTSEVYYHITGTARDTARVKAGEYVTVSYRGQRLEDGLVFDDTERNGEALGFRFGDKDQVIPGIEVAIHLLRPGQTGTFIFPSDQAFGEKGVPKVIEPYTPVIYTIRLEQVDRTS